jgi:hypothetical protein
MGGGLFPGHPFALNIKCIIFTALLAGGYWFAPHKNILVLIFLLWFPYIALAWYDYAYGCRDRLKPTLVPFGRYIWLPFKPPDYKEEFNRMPADQINAMNRVDHLVGWSIIAAAAGWFLLRKK